MYVLDVLKKYCKSIQILHLASNTPFVIAVTVPYTVPARCRRCWVSKQICCVSQRTSHRGSVRESVSNAVTVLKAKGRNAPHWQCALSVRSSAASLAQAHSAGYWQCALTPFWQGSAQSLNPQEQGVEPVSSINIGAFVPALGCK